MNNNNNKFDYKVTSSEIEKKTYKKTKFNLFYYFFNLRAISTQNASKKNYKFFYLLIIS